MIRDSRATILRAFVALSFAWALVPAVAEGVPRFSKPNVVLIMTDDQGYGDVSAHGNPWIKTPNLDRLASQSVRFDDYHVSPYCIPTRASLLTGRYADRTGIHNALNPHWFVRANETLLSNMFQDAGYATGMFGKWHLGENYPYGPQYRGFDEVLHHYGGAVGVVNDYWDNCYVDDTYYHNGVPKKTKGYCTDVFFAAATRFIEASAEQGKPFFAYLATNAPHKPLICPPAYAEPYENGKTHRVADLYGMIANIDDNVGKLRNFLHEKGLDENTVFIFASDNGTAEGHAIYNAGMRGKKMSPYDGGHRVPFFLHWPDGGFAEEKRIRTLTAHIDVAPTLLDLCGIAQPDGVEFDGVSLRPLLEQGDHREWPDRIIMTDAQYNGPPEKWHQTAILSEEWRLVGGKELFNIEADPGQKTNVYAKHPKVVQRLSSYYDALWDDLEPTFADIAEIPLGHPSAKSVALSYHDCMGRQIFWFQNGVRSIGGRIHPPDRKRRQVFWPVNVETDGKYTIELRRWPRELNAAIHADVPPGALVYDRPAHRTTPGEGFPAVEAQLSIGKQQRTRAVKKKDTSVIFRMKLSKGSQRLSGEFIDVQGRSLDAFYVYVRKR